MLQFYCSNTEFIACEMSLENALKKCCNAYIKSKLMRCYNCSPLILILKYLRMSIALKIYQRINHLYSNTRLYTFFRLHFLSYFIRNQIYLLTVNSIYIKTEIKTFVKSNNMLYKHDISALNRILFCSVLYSF